MSSSYWSKEINLQAASSTCSPLCCVFRVAKRTQWKSSQWLPEDRCVVSSDPLLPSTCTVLPLLIVNGPCLHVEYFIYFLRFHLLCCLSPNQQHSAFLQDHKWFLWKWLWCYPWRSGNAKRTGEGGRPVFGGNPFPLPILLLLAPDGDSVRFCSISSLRETKICTIVYSCFVQQKCVKKSFFDTALQWKSKP